MQKDDKRCRPVHNMCQHDEDKDVATQEFDVVRSKVLNFHSIRSVIIAKLETINSQKKTHTNTK